MYVLAKIVDKKYNITSAFADTCMCSTEKYAEMLRTVLEDKHKDIEVVSVVRITGTTYQKYKNYNLKIALLFISQQIPKVKKERRKEKLKAFFSFLF